MSVFDEVVRMVASLKPGQRCRVARSQMREIPTMEYNGGYWTPADRVLERVTGAGYGWSYFNDLLTGYTEFYRAVRTDYADSERTYVSPDRLDWYDKRGAIYVLKGGDL